MSKRNMTPQPQLIVLKTTCLVVVPKGRGFQAIFMGNKEDAAMFLLSYRDKDSNN